MSDDEGLDEAFAALREETSGASDDAAATRRKILLAATARKPRRTWMLRVLVPLAAVLAISTAWAAATGRLPRVYHATASLLFGETDRTPKSGAPGGTGPATSANGAPVTIDAGGTENDAANAANDAGSAANGAGSGANGGPDPANGAAETAKNAAETANGNASPANGNASPANGAASTANGAASPANRAASPANGATSSGAAASGAATATAKSRANDAEDALYRAAHEAHFVAKDSPRALAAWDAYLAAYPHGRFAPEARYNRAITLVRLGRKDEARAALQPFAEGAFGDYRRAEAQNLIDALR